MNTRGPASPVRRASALRNMSPHARRVTIAVIIALALLAIASVAAWVG